MTETISYDWNVDQTADLVRVIDRSQDTLQRPSGYVLEDTSTTPVVDTQVTYTYGSTDGRLATVSDGTDTFTYAYTANSNLIATVTGPQHTVTNTWESNRNVLGLKENEAGATLTSSYDYTVNDIGQRGSVDVAGSAYSGGQRGRSWTYDARGQLVAEDDANDNTLDRGFAFDGIGNRTASIDGNTDTTQTGNVSYTPNALNQYTAVGSFSPTYDADGNTEDTQIRTGGLGTTTLSDATYEWDGENRLVKILDGSSNTIAEYVYDSQSRRVRRTVSGGADIAYVYDGWNPIAEYDLSSTPALLLVNLWGIDLSGSAQGAGGVGGLLSVSTSSDTYYPTYDGNGNVSEYLDDTGAIAAHYEYDAFGNVVNYTESAAGVASTFRHRFSTKQQDDESGLLYYGYRYYDPFTGRWPSRDPIEESGCINIYCFVNNNINEIDYLGLSAHRDAIKKGKLRYSANCGWIDSKHMIMGARIAKDLRRELLTARLSNKKMESIEIGTRAIFNTGFRNNINTLRGKYYVRVSVLSGNGHFSVAHGIFADMSYRHEIRQWYGTVVSSLIPFYNPNRSGYSEEDLTSNYLGFLIGYYRMTQNDIESECAVENDTDINLCLYDKIGGLGFNNRWLQPTDYNTEYIEILEAAGETVDFEALAFPDNLTKPRTSGREGALLDGYDWSYTGL